MVPAPAKELESSVPYASSRIAAFGDQDPANLSDNASAPDSSFAVADIPGLYNNADLIHGQDSDKKSANSIGSVYIAVLVHPGKSDLIRLDLPAIFSDSPSIRR